MVWDTTTGNRIHTLRDKSDTMMALQYLAIDPISSTPDALVLVSSSSDPHIRRWRISLESAGQIQDLNPSTQESASRDTILEHETSVYSLLFDTDDEEDMNLWTASADGTAKCLARRQNWATEETYTHGDYVRAIALTPEWVITAGRDEDVKIWDRATGKLWHVYDGHYEEVTGLVILPSSRTGEERLVSVSIDGTLRVWALGKSELQRARTEAEDKANGKSKVAEDEKITEGLMTAEEEAELAELMDD